MYLELDMGPGIVTESLPRLQHTHQLMRVIKLYGLDRSRGEEDLSTHTLYDTVLEVPHDGCNKNSRRSW